MNLRLFCSVAAVIAIVAAQQIEGEGQTPPKQGGSREGEGSRGSQVFQGSGSLADSTGTSKSGSGFRSDDFNSGSSTSSSSSKGILEEGQCSLQTQELISEISQRFGTGLIGNGGRWHRRWSRGGDLQGLGRGLLGLNRRLHGRDGGSNGLGGGLGSTLVGGISGRFRDVANHGLVSGLIGNGGRWHQRWSHGGGLQGLGPGLLGLNRGLHGRGGGSSGLGGGPGSTLVGGFRGRLRDVAGHGLGSGLIGNGGRWHQRWSHGGGLQGLGPGLLGLNRELHGRGGGSSGLGGGPGSTLVGGFRGRLRDVAGHGLGSGLIGNGDRWHQRWSHGGGLLGLNRGLHGRGGGSSGMGGGLGSTLVGGLRGRLRDVTGHGLGSGLIGNGGRWHQRWSHGGGLQGLGRGLLGLNRRLHGRVGGSNGLGGGLGSTLVGGFRGRLRDVAGHGLRSGLIGNGGRWHQRWSHSEGSQGLGRGLLGLNRGLHGRGGSLSGLDGELGSTLVRGFRGRLRDIADHGLESGLISNGGRWHQRWSHGGGLQGLGPGLLGLNRELHGRGGGSSGLGGGPGSTLVGGFRGRLRDVAGHGLGSGLIGNGDRWHQRWSHGGGLLGLNRGLHGRGGGSSGMGGGLGSTLVGGLRGRLRDVTGHGLGSGLIGNGGRWHQRWSHGGGLQGLGRGLLGLNRRLHGRVGGSNGLGGGLGSTLVGGFRGRLRDVAGHGLRSGLIGNGGRWHQRWSHSEGSQGLGRGLLGLNRGLHGRGGSLSGLGGELGSTLVRGFRGRLRDIADHGLESGLISNGGRWHQRWSHGGGLQGLGRGLRGLGEESQGQGGGGSIELGSGLGAKLIGGFRGRLRDVADHGLTSGLTGKRGSWHERWSHGRGLQGLGGESQSQGSGGSIKLSGGLGSELIGGLRGKLRNIIDGVPEGGVGEEK